ncbi:MAG: Biotin-[acetyl-CoA-carboxylase] ligase [candidate division TM6 bacterium GW2011_GWF2_38_10]|nr:MAG: Biotin-[acetyl-CoA-carboxylase] ligase [candidate division TM6 bacterium GW2011_GWF2_38_10]
MSIGTKLFRVHTCEDSIAWACEHIADAPDGSIFLADTLLQARGRQGRSWVIYDGQLLITMLLKPALLQTVSSDDIPIRLNQLNIALTVGIVKVLAPYGVGLKWPNDFMCCDKKVGGMLAHVVWQCGRPAGVVIGLGFNVNTIFNPEDELYSRATSLAACIGHEIDRRTLYKALLVSMDVEYGLWGKGMFDQAYKTWRSMQLYLGRYVEIHQKDGALIRGIMKQVLPNGDMMLSEDNQTLRAHIIPYSVVSDVIIPA